MLEKKSTLLLSLTIILSTLIVPALNVYIYFSTVDFSWLLNELVKTGSINQDAEQILTPKILMSFTIATTCVATAMVMVFWYLYFRRLFEKRCAGSSGDDVVDYVCFSFIGSAVSAWITFFLLLTRDVSQARLNDLKVFSINSLWLNQEADSKWYSVATSVDIMSLLGFAAVLFLFDRYSSKSMMVNFGLAILPDVVFYGLWSIYLYFKR